MMRLIQLTLILLVALSACAGVPGNASSKKMVRPAIPAEYREEVETLNAIIKSYHKRVLPSFDAKHAGTHIRLGVIYFNIGNFEEARYNLKRAINMRSGMPEAHFYLGRVLNETGDPELAIEEYNNALKFDSDLMEIHQYLGETYRSLGMDKKAALEFQIYDAAKPKAFSDP